ncbi:hypothetical protein NLJ89_g7632 [Agrocybe chaxingu]|uniref:Uncharacterized protein n=1 Tax=Agrocybe chaxingu TaxID=84603 RepID=A0A9W8JVZ9_9AGAR|nr:hypothetical protein NLJ89_g7632 [Agrocybe chaxingu]
MSSFFSSFGPDSIPTSQRRNSPGFTTSMPSLPDALPSSSIPNFSDPDFLPVDFSYGADGSSSSPNARLKGKHKDPINVLGMITLADLDRLESEGRTGRGWIACTTDAIFMEKPSYYDLLIDLTTSTPNKTTRPTFYASKPTTSQNGSSRTPPYRLSTIRFAWSDVKLWSEIDRILALDASHGHTCCSSSFPSSSSSPSPDTAKSKSITAWTDVWQVYEDVCIICAGLWMGIGSWRGNSAASYSTANGPENWGAIRLEGDDDLSLRGMVASDGERDAGKDIVKSSAAYVRNVGMGIEGGLSTKAPGAQAARQASSSTAGGAGPSSPTPYQDVIAEQEDEELQEELEARRTRQVRTTLAVLQTFHAHTAFQLSVLEDFLARSGASPSSVPTTGAGAEKVISLSPKDILAFELGPLSGFDARYLEWLAQEYAPDGVRIVLRRGWKDLLGAIFGHSPKISSVNLSEDGEACAEVVVPETPLLQEQPAPTSPTSIPHEAAVPVPVVAQSQIKTVEQTLKRIQDDVARLHNHRRKHRSRINSTLQLITDRFNQFDDRLAEVNAECTSLYDQVDMIQPVDIPDLQNELEAVQERVDEMPLRLMTPEPRESSPAPAPALNEREDVKASVQALHSLVDEMKHLRETTQQQATEELEAIKVLREAAMSNIAAAQAEVKALVVQAKQAQQVTAAAMEVTKTPVLTSLKWKRDDTDENEEGSGEDVVMDGGAAAPVPTAPFIRMDVDLVKTHVVVDGPRPRKRARRFASVVAQTATAVTIGAVVTWSALAFC